MSELKPEPGELRATINVTRAATGLVETFEVVGHSDPAKLAELVAKPRVHGAVGGMTGQGSGIEVI